MSDLLNEDTIHKEVLLGLDHFVVHVDNDSSKLKKLKEEIKPKGFPFEPEKGKGTSGFKANNIFIGKQYFEIVHLLDSAGGGWPDEWVKKYNKGQRGIISIFIKVNDIHILKDQLKEMGVNIRGPERLSMEDKGFKIVMPFQLIFTPALEGTDLEINFIQYDPGIKEKMTPPMELNAEQNGIIGIEEAEIILPQMKKNINLLKKIFPHLQEVMGELLVVFNKTKIRFSQSNTGVLKVILKALCQNKTYLDKTFILENVIVKTVPSKN